MPSLSDRRSQILAELAQLDSMEYGCLRMEHRPAAGGGTTGPYFQHQVWDQGKNLSQRIPAAEAPALKAAIANRQQAEALAQEYIDATVQMTRQGSEDASIAKKNGKRWKRPSLRKPKRS